MDEAEAKIIRSFQHSPRSDGGAALKRFHGIVLLGEEQKRCACHTLSDGEVSLYGFKRHT